MLDFDAAKRVAAEYLSLFDHKPGGPHIIRDSECEEYEWGWMIEWGPSRPEMLPPEERQFDKMPVLVDRVTGHLQTVSTSGPRLAIMMLLDRRPADSRSRDVSAEELGGLTRLSVSMRAFTPLRDLQRVSSEPANSVEVFRLSDRGY